MRSYMPIMIAVDLVFVPGGSWHRAPKTFGISGVIRVSLCATEITGGWGPLNSFRLGLAARKAKAQSEGWNL